MKKEINSKSKRKWIMGGLAGFASIALLTTGFALYVVGTTQTEASGNVKVTVDTAENKSIFFDFKLEDKAQIDLRENAISEGKIVKVEQKDTVENPLRISTVASTIKFGSSLTFDYKSIEFSIAEPTEDEKKGEYKYASVKVDNTNGNKLSGNYARTGSDFTYINAPKAISLTPYIGKGQIKEEGNTNTITIPSITLDFTWGSFFDNKSPATYYNEKYADESDYATLTTAADEITTELTAMYNQLNDHNIKLVAKLSTTEAPSA